MEGLTWFFFVYCLGGLTFLPLVIIAILLHAYFTFLVHDDTDLREATESILRPGDDVDAIKSAQKSLGEKFRLHNNHEAEVAAGYFAICREYSPGGVNGKPPERTTPVGSATVSAPSPSVYQSMYRSLFERKTNNGPLDNKAAGKPQKKGGNVFYVVLRHGHLMLFDDEDQLEVRYVVSLAHHDVSIYSGPNDITPEGELFIKRNAICLSRKQGVGEMTADGKPSQPFYLFSENCSDKEDFYFALLRNQDSDSTPKPPIPLQYDVKDIITLVQRLHSSEEHLQTRWINALVGRVFLALYKTPDIEDFIRTKITKKISRVKTPNFLRQITLRNVNMGEAAPVITNPRLKDLTVDGELVVEADVRYTGNFRLEVAAIARLELGARFKAREVNLLLAVVLKKIEGHMLLRIKPPPSNRLWVTFETMPKIDMTIEPIVSSRQITYTLILRQIENRIKEVVAESLVYPNWDDSPFASTVGKLWRGGIWADDRRAEHSQDAEAVAAEHGDVDEVEISEAEHDESATSTPQIEKSYSTPVLDTNLSNTVHSRKGAKSTSNLTNPFPSSSSTGVDARPSTDDKPRVLRSGSFANASCPVVTTDITNADAFKPSSPPDGDHAATAMAKLSAKTEFPVQSPTGSPNRPTNFKPSSSQSSSSSRGSSHSEKADMSNSIPQVSLEPSSLTDRSSINSYPSSPASLSTTSTRSELSASKNFGTPKHENTTSSTKSSASETRRLSLAAVTNAAATAKTWGWNAIQRRNEQRGSSSPGSTEAAHPRVMGRGQPLPPPGVPLPLPDKKTKTAPIPVPKRKPMPPPVLPQRHEREPPTGRQHHTAPAPPLPRRNSRKDTDTGDDGLLIVSAPSEPTTPVTEDSPHYMQPWVDDVDEMDENQQAQADAPSPAASVAREPPQLPKRRHPHRVVSSSPEEDGHQLPSWMAAQEQEARAKSTFVDEDAGL